MRSFISKNKFTFTVFTLLSLLAATAWIYVKEPTYKSESTVNVSSTNGIGDVNTVAAQLTSKPFLAKAIAGKGLNVDYQITSDFRTYNATYASPYSVKFESANENFHQRNYKISFNSTDKFTLSRYEYGQLKTIAGQIGTPITDRKVTIYVTSKDRPVQAHSFIIEPEYSFTIYSDHALAESLFENGRAVEATTESGMIHLSCIHNSPIKAKTIVDALTAHYAQILQKNYNGDVMQSVAHIDEQIEGVAKQLDASQNILAEFKVENRLLSLAATSEAALLELNQLQLQKVDLDMQMAALDNISMYLRKNRTVNNSMVDYGTITDPLFTENISALSNKYREKEQLKNTGQDTQRISAEIELMKESIAESVLNTRKKTYVKKEEILNAISRAKTKISSFPQVERQLASMERKLEMDRKVYDMLVEKRADAIIHSTIPTTTLSVIQPSVIPNEPYAPNISKVLAISLIISLLLSAVVGIFRSGMPTKIKSRTELEKETTIPFIGNITTSVNNGLEYMPSSFTDMCTRLLMKNTSDDCQVLTIASTLKGEGKTYVASNLAKTIAALDKKILMIDMNTQQQDLEQLFEIQLDQTLADVLEGPVDIHDAVGITSIPNLEIIAGGDLKAGINTLLTSTKTNIILTQLKQHYDYIIVDTPETGIFIDAVPMMKMSDLTLYVIKANNTAGEQLANAELIRTDYDIENMFMVLNSSKKTAGHTGMMPRGSYKKLKRDEGPKIVDEKVSFLRKIALWFY